MAKNSPKLSRRDRSSLARPPDNFEELSRKVADRLSEQKRVARAAGVTPAKLRALVARAERAQAREDKVALALEKRLRPLRDARLVAASQAWRTALRAYNVAAAIGKSDEGIARAFAFFGNAFKHAAKRAAGAKK